MYALSGDIGGTNARIRLIEIVHGAARVLRTERYLSEDFDDFSSVLEKFLNDACADIPIEHVCIAAAGLVIDGTVKFTNLNWQISEKSLSQRFNIPSVELVNDLVAAAHGIDELESQDFVELQKGASRNHEPMAIIGVGTGFGQAMIDRSKGALRVFGSEGGHANFAPRNQLAVDLLRHLWREKSHVSVETVLCGSGLERIYNFLLNRSEVRAPSKTCAEAIVRLAGEGDETAKLAVTQFVGDLGAQAGNAAISYLATSGVYIVGGMISSLNYKLAAEQFLPAFNDKGPMSFLTERIPVRLVQNKDIGLLGATAIARNRLVDSGRYSVAI